VHLFLLYQFLFFCYLLPLVLDLVMVLVLVVAVVVAVVVVVVKYTSSVPLALCILMKVLL
jgi:hypothetical protein